ncbi:MAG TPA: hypothetical protein VGE07_17430 [Herpetosiphonaceae bacterium]
MNHSESPWAALLEAAERLRAQRKTEGRLAARRGPPAESGAGRRYTVAEMQGEVPGYKSLYEGRAMKPPTPALVDAIAAYLECSLAEQNTLRGAAGLPLAQSDPQGEELRAQLELLLDTIQALPFPAHVVTRDWSIYAANRHALAFLGMAAVDLVNIPAERCTLLHFIFDERLGLRQRMTGGKGGWRAIAERNLSAFWLNNRHVLHEPALKALLADLRALPGGEFAEIWEQAQRAVPAWSPFASADYTMEMESLADRAAILRVRVLHIQHGAMAFPSILGYIPVGAEAQRIYAAMGLSAHERQPAVRTAVYAERFAGARRAAARPGD